MKPEDIKRGDILRAPDGELWNAEYIFPNKIVAVQRIDVFDLTGWEKAGSYNLTGKEIPR